ncbi:MAG: LapA family protein [Gottschalkiaceae bacterium]|nr:MAG: LapA family protein [Gottschalkiaceae bacterium]
MQAGFIISLFFAIIVAVFALKNGGSVNIDFIFAKVQVSQAIVIFVSAALGAVIVAFLGLVRQVKLTMKLKEQGKLINSLNSDKQSLENEIHILKEGKTMESYENLNEVKEIMKEKDGNSNTEGENNTEENV